MGKILMSERHERVADRVRNKETCLRKSPKYEYNITRR